MCGSMDDNEIIEPEKELYSSPTISLIVAVAISGSRKSKHILAWALEKFISEAKVVFRLIHVFPHITKVPTPMGNYLPISRVRDDIAYAHRKDMECKALETVLPYKKMCSQKKVPADVIVMESDDISNAISREISKSSVNHLVIGTSSMNRFTRKFKSHNICSKLSECAPSFCTVYAISNGKLSSVRQSTSEHNEVIKDGISDTSSIYSTNDFSSCSFSSRSDESSRTPHSRFYPPSLTFQRCQALSTINKIPFNTDNYSLNISKCRSLRVDPNSKFPNKSDFPQTVRRVSSQRSSPTRTSISDQISALDYHINVSPEIQIGTDLELERLRIELRHTQGMYAVTQSETNEASRKLTNLNKRRSIEETKLKKLNHKEELARELARREKKRYEAAKIEAERVNECAEREATQRKEAERKARQETGKREKAQNALAGLVQQYRTFTWDEIMNATSALSESLKIGIGAYGVVYKGSFQYTAVAVKVLHSKEALNDGQFQQELEILGKIRHPHWLPLIGACPEHGCIVYEYMENGSLDDRLCRKNNTPPIPWFDRFRISREVASALLFLHTLKPKPVVHRDLKPSNILLDRNFVAKIGDVGVSKTYSTTVSNDTGIVGTMCYIDPEYQRTGLTSPKSDIYALGIVILQLLTAKPALALSHMVENALERGSLNEILDSGGGEWPVEEAKELAEIGLKCSEIRRKDRPDLNDEIIPILKRLEKVVEWARDSASRVHQPPPSHFVCPIVQDVMIDPCVASDGYTYDRNAIEMWLEKKENSPMTNVALPNKNLIPNYTLLSAIMEWKSRKH